MKVLMLGRSDLFSAGGVDKVQIDNTAAELRKLGIEVDIDVTSDRSDFIKYDIVHVFQLDWVLDTYFHIKNAKKFGKPYTTTSANVSGQKSERDVDTILQRLSDNHYASVLQKTAIGIDLVIDAGELPERQPSTVVNLSGEEPVILREGAIPNSEIWNVIRSEA